MIEAQLGEDGTYFTTKAFLIRYQEEEVELNDLILFRAEVDVREDYLETDFYLDADLYFCDMSKQGGVENWKDKKVTHSEFKLMQSQTYLIKSPARSILEYCPITFR